MNQFEMVAIIVVAVMIASIFKARYGHSRRRRGGEPELTAQEQGETLRLREEVKMLKDRIQTLERITVDKENSLAREIDSLRDR
jgi:uncharacterized protein YlxW (UPF0749 family)